MIRCNKEKRKKKFRNIEIISFDAGFTLLEPNPSFGGILAAEAELLGYRCEPEILNERLFRAHHKYVQMSRNRGKGMYACQMQSKYFWDKITTEAFGQSIDSKDAQQLADECYDRLSTGKAWRLFDDVLPTLNYLSEKGYRLIVLSNWDGRFDNQCDCGIDNLDIVCHNPCLEFNESVKSINQPQNCNILRQKMPIRSLLL